MKDIFNLLIHSGLTTKLFVLGSIFTLSLVQFILFRISFRMITISLLHILFGLLLSRVTHYNPLVHLVLYIIPSGIISSVMILIFPRKRNTSYIPGPFDLSFKTNKGDLILNPFAGVCILGVPKAGKTASIVKPTIEQLALKNYCGAIYDYKKWDLTSVAYSHYQNHPVVDFKMVCPFDLNYSNRVNPISPRIIQHPAYAVEAAFVFLSNMMGSGKNNGSDRYWVESASGVLAGVIWRLRCDYPEYCDLPHAISIVINKPVNELTEFLQKNDQAVFLAASYFKSLVSEKQTAGILGTLASSLSKVAIPELFYLLSGDEVDLDLNHPDHPTLLTLSTIQTLDKTYAPALALIVSMSLKMMNQEGRHHSAIVLDEAPTLIVPEFDKIPATARSNKIATFFIAQDMVQGEDGYGRIGRDKILATLSTHLYGKVTDPDTADRYSKMFGTEDKYYTSRSRKAGAWGNSGYTDSLREIRKFKPERFHQLGTGEFIGVIGEGNMKEFNAKFRCYQETLTQLPLVRNISKIEIQQVFEKIIEEAKSIIE